MLVYESSFHRQSEDVYKHTKHPVQHVDKAAQHHFIDFILYRFVLSIFSHTFYLVCLLSSISNHVSAARSLSCGMCS